MQTFQQPTSFQNGNNTTNNYENLHQPFYPTTAPPRYEDVTSESSTSIEQVSTPRLDPQDIQEVDKTLSWIPPPPSQNLQRTLLSAPILIPTLTPKSLIGGPPPFLRAYPPTLNCHSTTITDFLSFIDNLAVARSPSPPFQVLNIASMGVGMVPHHWAQAASAGIGVAAGAGTAAVSYARTKRYLERVNVEFFGPRGLKVKLVKDGEVEGIVGFPADRARLAPLDASNLGMSLRDRRLRALEGFIAPLSFDIPPPAEQTNVLDRISAKQISRKISKSEKKELEKQEKQIKKQRETSRQSDNQSDDSDASSIVSLECKLQNLELKIDRINGRAEERKRNAKDSNKFDKIEEKRIEEVEKMEKEIKKKERDLEKKTEKVSKRAEKREGKACKSSKEEDKENKKVRKLEWIVIENL